MLPPTAHPSHVPNSARTVPTAPPSAPTPAPAGAEAGQGAHFRVIRQFNGQDVIGHSREGFLVLSDGRMVTPSLGMQRGKLDLSGPVNLSDYGIVREQPREPPSRSSAGFTAPPSFVQHSIPEFRRRIAGSPQIAGIESWVSRINQDSRPPDVVVKELQEVKKHFEGLISDRKQTDQAEKQPTARSIKPILNAENARNPGLNAIHCKDEDELVRILKALPDGGTGEDHVRFHLGIVAGVHSLAVDAFRHADGRFTLVAVDSIAKDMTGSKMNKITEAHPDTLHGAMVLPTLNQAHLEGCPIFTVNNLLAMHEFEPYVNDLHKGLLAKVSGKGEPSPAPVKWKRVGKNVLVPEDQKDTFKILPAKFFKHMQGGSRLNAAEERNPAFKTETVNKKGETLRTRFQNQNPEKKIEEYDNFERSLSLDKKRLVYLDRAIVHYSAPKLIMPGESE